MKVVIDGSEYELKQTWPEFKAMRAAIREQQAKRDADGATPEIIAAADAEIERLEEDALVKALGSSLDLPPDHVIELTMRLRNPEIAVLERNPTLGPGKS